MRGARLYAECIQHTKVCPRESVCGLASVQQHRVAGNDRAVVLSYLLLAG